MPEHLVHEHIDLTKGIIQQLSHPFFAGRDLSLHVLRLDLIHPVISGNKWFKLKNYIAEALKQQKKGILSFGGAWSNHILATAFACREAGLSSTGIIRGEEPPQLSHTLRDAARYGMELRFTGRASYSRHLQEWEQWQASWPDHLIVPEGGQGEAGVAGAATIGQLIPPGQYSHIACAAGTGTMMAGLIRSREPGQLVMGISALKIDPGNNSIADHIRRHTGEEPILFHDYHFGGYARINAELVQFMNDLYASCQLPTDIVYTGKLLYALFHLAAAGYFPKGGTILAIHSGGLQGNRSLKKDNLIF